MAAVVETAAPPQQAAPAAAQPQNSSLYVGDLDRDATEASLYELFSQVGPVASIRVCRDAVTRRSLGYAYVNYNSSLDPQAAERALDALNYAVVNGRPIRIMWSHRDPAFRKSGVGNIFIKNMDKSIDNKALHDTFNQFGNILSCKVAQTPDGNSKGYGFVHFETEEAANLAIEKVNGMQLADKIVYVGKFLKRSDRGGGDNRFTNVYIKNLPEDVDDAGLKVIAEEFGEVTSAVVMMGGETKSKGFGFVNFAEPESAGKAVEVLNGTERNNKTLYAGRAQKKAEREAMLKQKFDELRQERMAKYAGMNLYIKNLADEVDDELLRSEFASHGTITSAKVMADEKGKSKGFGFVCYTSGDEATKAVTEMNGKMLKGKPLYVALAQRKEVRRAQLQQQLNQQRMAMQAAGRGAPGMPGMFPGGPAPMFYAGPGMPGRGGPMAMYPGMMPGAGRMGPGGRGPRGGPMGPMAPGPMMMGAPMAAGMAARGGRGMGGRGGRSMGRGEFGMPEPPMMMMGAPDGGRGRGFEGGRGAGRGRGCLLLLHLHLSRGPLIRAAAVRAAARRGQQGWAGVGRLGAPQARARRCAQAAAGAAVSQREVGGGGGRGRGATRAIAGRPPATRHPRHRGSGGRPTPPTRISGRCGCGGAGCQCPEAGWPGWRRPPPRPGPAPTSPAWPARLPLGAAAAAAGAARPPPSTQWVF